jgi:hypothetical protein
MKLPFSIEFNSKILTQSKVNISDVLASTKEYIDTVSYKSAYDFVIDHGKLTFKVNFWNLGRVNDFDGISKAKFSASSDAETLWLSYAYQIGGSFIYTLVVSIIVLLFAILIVGKSFSEIFPGVGFFYITISIVSWISTWFNQKRLFKEIVRNLVSKYDKAD